MTSAQFFFVLGPPQSGKRQLLLNLTKGHFRNKKIVFVDVANSPSCSMFSQQSSYKHPLLEVRSTENILEHTLKRLSREDDSKSIPRAQVGGVWYVRGDYDVVVINRVNDLPKQEIEQVISALCAINITVLAAGVSYDSKGVLSQTVHRCVDMATKVFTTRGSVPLVTGVMLASG